MKYATVKKIIGFGVCSLLITLVVEPVHATLEGKGFVPSFKGETCLSPATVKALFIKPSNSPALSVEGNTWNLVKKIRINLVQGVSLKA